MKQISFIAIIALLVACDPSTNSYPINNNSTSNGDSSNECNAEGVLAMSAAPIVIDSKVSKECGETSLSVKTVIVSNDRSHSSARVCEENLRMELYYSTDREAIKNLSSENLTRELPTNVGRLVHKFSESPYADLMQPYYVSNGSSYSINRLEFKVKLPNIIIDLHSFQKESTNESQNALSPIALSKISSSTKLRNGQTVYYRWAKYIRNESDEDVLLFELNTSSLVVELSLDVEANSPFRTIDLNRETRSLLNARIIGDTNDVDSFRWRYKRVNFGPEIEPIIHSPFLKSTEVEFLDFGLHSFEFELTDKCGNTITDTVSIMVNGNRRTP